MGNESIGYTASILYLHTQYRGGKFDGDNFARNIRINTEQRKEKEKHKNASEG